MVWKGFVNCIAFARSNVLAVEFKEAITKVSFVIDLSSGSSCCGRMLSGESGFAVAALITVAFMVSTGDRQGARSFRSFCRHYSLSFPGCRTDCKV